MTNPPPIQASPEKSFPSPNLRGVTLILFLFLAACSQPPGQREADRGRIELERGNPVRAEALLERSIERRPAHPDNAITFNLLGLALHQQGRFNEAQDAFENSRRINPLLAEPVFNLGILAAERGNLREAARYLNDAARMVPDHPVALEVLAALHLERGQPGPARNALLAAEERDPRNPRILTALARAEHAAGNPEPALDLLLRALERNPRFPPAHYNPGVLHETSLNAPEQARPH
ncbi:MAG TPA: tetratricopeptide repeat protein, partial [Kiritimatiellia bacterium]|nr:tetratricopeptide repeat protein [Kiritimatiellia bacterium]